MIRHLASSACAALALALASPVLAQNITAPDAVVPAGITVESVMVHGASLEGNLEGNSADREVMVVLPPSYASNPNRHYPVVYYLHGFAISGRDFYDFMQVPTAVADNAAAGREFIVVVPDTLTAMGGSMYANSVTTGNFRDFVATDLVAYIDATYRTIPERGSRALVGHSMGGYGTWMVGMAHPEQFAVIWAQSACCVSPRRETPETGAAMAAVPRDGADASGFGMRAGLASAVAWAPNPANPPYFVDWPVDAAGKVDELVMAKWANNSPLAQVASHVTQLASFTAIGADVGDQDSLMADDLLMHEELNKFGIAHDWAVYEGTHVDRIGPRFSTVVLPWVASHIAMTRD
ncbi:alpha/beta fold hydrolase [Aurantiacibacter xanthus]|uniref:Alpha/beta fold hydrolase n=1 Tax=Aurantiacibacter xanthus TaxID=1784712 RepID=A0A3A1P853_9SPHN|nr:alpha/beta fold hydrolase [Aurantiacibacter xanthus]RIV89734.1 alpha/beta fold hydrolase [Aurantiacibacter xanthus]